MRERSDQKGGGLMIIWRENEDIIMEKMETKSNDILLVESKVNKMEISIVLIYMSVNDYGRNAEIRKEIKTIVGRAQQNEREIIILGDFNGHLGFIGSQKLDTNGKMILELMETYKLILLNDVPECKGAVTWQQGEKKSTIDFILTSEKLFTNFENMIIDENWEETCMSDHNLIKATFWTSKTQRRKYNKEKEIQIFKINNSRKEKFLKEVKEEIQDKDEINLHDFNNVIKNKATKCMKVTIKIDSERNKLSEPIWMNKKIKAEISKRREINKEKRKTTSAQQKNMLSVAYEKQKTKVHLMVRDAMEEHERNMTKAIMEDRNRGKRTWEHINTLKNLNKHKKKETEIYSENGNKIPEEEIQQQILDKWTPIYQANNNDISTYWSDEQRNIYTQFLNSNIINHQYSTGLEYNRERGGIVPHMEEINFSSDILEHMELAFRIDHIYKMETPNITPDEIKEQIKKMRNGKAAGPDEIKAEVYKCILDDNDLITMMAYLLNKTLEEGNVPNDWKQSKTIMVEKTKKPKANEFRPIALTNVYYKIFMGIIKNKIEKHILENNIISDYQAGSTPKRRIEDNLFLLRHCIEKTFKRKKTMYILSIDYSKAFDSVRRGKMIEILKSYKIHENIINILAKVYQGDSTEILINNKKFAKIDISSGIRQGCNVSALLFIMVTYKIIDHLKGLNIGFKDQEINIPVLFYVDDGLILTHSENDLKRSIHEVEKISKEYGLKLNRNKCKIMIINGKKEIKDIEGIEVVSETKYLGVIVENTRTCFKKQKDKVLEKAKRMNNLMFSVINTSCNRMLIGKTFWKGLAMSSFLYSHEILCFNKREKETIQRADNRAYRDILGVPVATAVEFLRGEVGASSHIARDMKGKLLYIKHAITENKNKTLEKTMINEIQEAESKWSKQVNEYMMALNLNTQEIRNSSINKIRKLINEYDLVNWRRGMEEKVTLDRYRCFKTVIKEEKWFKNGEKYILMMKARSNTLNLEWKSWGTDEEKICKLCNEEDEDMKHFLVKCNPLQQIRQQCLELQRPNCEQMEETMNRLLIFTETRTEKIEENINFLYKLWLKRKRMRNEILMLRSQHSTS